MYINSITKLPASWAGSATASSIDGINGHTSSDLPESFLTPLSVRTVYGLVPLRHALDWPIFASYDELSSCARFYGGRIPTFSETRSIYHFAASLSNKTNRKLSRTVPAVNGHLSGDGVEETPPTIPGPSRNVSLFMDLDGCNVGFQHWHPVPVTGKGGELGGQGAMGGVWEWTSSVLEKWDGFEPMELYPAYTADFFDGKHNIVLGGSWSTHPRIAGRKSL
jgi:formylglycine-generating enzyme required for sulfatase activity